MQFWDLKVKPVDTRNTITHNNVSRLGKALQTLESLCHEQSVPILNFLQEHESAAILDLTLHTGMDSSTLEAQLDRLCLTRVVEQRTDVYGSRYHINYPRLVRVKAIAKKLASFRQPR